MWGSNLEGVRVRPVKLPDMSKLVYSPHVYGPSVTSQEYFGDASFPANLVEIWDAFFGFVPSSSGSAVVIGEWGGWMTNLDAVWQKAFASYLHKRQLGSFYWALNPTSRDTGGLLLSDWTTTNHVKQALLQPLMSSAPFLAPTAAVEKGRGTVRSLSVEPRTPPQSQRLNASSARERGAGHPMDRR
mmetsp:Transcript_31696/g.93427  ORF Transcript_31696/g.93427 Transcript_31696/m.93427 type:complete len:186 (+) Transcript_31696:852-1409(+)